MENTSGTHSHHPQVLPRFSSLTTRFIALMIDCLILIISTAVVNSVLPIIGGFIVWFLYGPIFESSSVQATIGKKLMGIQVAGLNGERISLKAAFIRNLMKIVSSVVLLIGFIVALFSVRKQTLHDIVAETVVIDGESRESITDAWVTNTKEAFDMASHMASHMSSHAAKTHFPSGNSRSSESRLAQLERLNALREKGALTEEEFLKEKQRILNE